MNPGSGTRRRTSLPRRFAGLVAVAALALLARAPCRLVLGAGTLLLPFYIPLRRRTRAKLRRHCPHVTPLRYYRMRLRLAWLSLRHATDRPDHCRHHIENARLFTQALATGRPVVLLGWHQGPVELLHRIPVAHLQEMKEMKGTKDMKKAGGEERGFHLMTASAFSPALAEWMASGRRRGHRIPMRLIRPGDPAGLRDWARTRGVLAVMVDQVPGVPDETLAPGAGLPVFPWPRRLMDWVLTQNPVVLAVSVRWHPEPAHDERRPAIVFRYHPVTGDEGRGDEAACRNRTDPTPGQLEPAEPGARTTQGRPAGKRDVKERVGSLMRVALREAPEQYNWSYGKIGSPVSRAPRSQGVDPRKD